MTSEENLLHWIRHHMGHLVIGRDDGDVGGTSWSGEGGPGQCTVVTCFSLTQNCFALKATSVWVRPKQYYLASVTHVGKNTVSLPDEHI